MWYSHLLNNRIHFVTLMEKYWKNVRILPVLCIFIGNLTI